LYPKKEINVNTHIFFCKNHSGSQPEKYPDLLGISWVEADNEEEAKNILDKRLIGRGSKPFAKLPYEIRNFCKTDEAKERVCEPYYSSIIWKSY
jgi:hypothetical protein